MGFIKWNSSYDLNHEEIDNQHRIWFDIANSFYEGMKEHVTDEKMSETLKKFQEYSEMHFCVEEKYMQDIQFPRYALHRKIHESFVSRVKYFYGLMLKKKQGLNQEIWDFIKNWMVNHIMIEDKKISRYKQDRDSRTLFA